MTSAERVSREAARITARALNVLKVARAKDAKRHHEYESAGKRLAYSDLTPIALAYRLPAAPTPLAERLPASPTARCGPLPRVQRHRLYLIDSVAIMANERRGCFTEMAACAVVLSASSGPSFPVEQLSVKITWWFRV